MFKRAFFFLLAVVLLVGVAAAAVIAYPPGKGKPATETSSSSEESSPASSSMPSDEPSVVPVLPSQEPSSASASDEGLFESDSSSVEPAVVYDSPDARTEETKSCPSSVKPMDITYYVGTASLDEYQTWFRDRCGHDSVLIEDPTANQLTDEENARLVYLMNKAPAYSYN